MGGIVFISYRRGDTEHVAGRLVDRLEIDFTREQLFFDVDNIPPGEDFVDYLDKHVNAADVLLAVIGPNWQTELDSRDFGSGGGQTRDFVRIEIEAALRQGKRVIPVLVSGAEMPAEEVLPPGLKPLARRNAVRLSHERFRSDVQTIVDAVKAVFAAAEQASGSSKGAAAAPSAKPSAGQSDHAKEPEPAAGADQAPPASAPDSRPDARAAAAIDEIAAALTALYTRGGNGSYVIAATGNHYVQALGERGADTVYWEAACDGWYEKQKPTADEDKALRELGLEAPQANDPNRNYRGGVVAQPNAINNLAWTMWLVLSRVFGHRPDELKVTAQIEP